MNSSTRAQIRSGNFAGLRRVAGGWVVPGLLFWQLRRLWAINMLAVVTAGLYVLLRVAPMTQPELLMLFAIILHCGLIVWKLRRSLTRQASFLETQGYTHDQIWWQTMFASFASGAAVCVAAWLLMVLQVRCFVQDRWFVNPYFPFSASKEYWVPWTWLFAYAIVLPLMHFAWVRARQPCEGAASGWLIMVLGLCLLAWCLGRISGPDVSTGILVTFAALHLPAAILLIAAGRKLYGTMEANT